MSSLYSNVNRGKLCMRAVLTVAREFAGLWVDAVHDARPGGQAEVHRGRRGGPGNN